MNARRDPNRRREMTAEQLIETLKAAGLNPKLVKYTNGDRKVVVGGLSSSKHHSKEEVEVFFGADGNVERASKYAYLLPDSVPDSIRLA